MHFKKVNFILLSIISLLSQNIFAQWTYKTDRKITKDIIINYAVSYQKKLTAKEKASPSFIKEIVVILNKNKLIEKQIRVSYNKSKTTMIDYNKEQFYNLFPTKKYGFSYDLKEPKTKGTLQKEAAKKISGLKCDKYTIVLKGKPIEIYTTKELGVKFVKKFGVEGLLMEYTDYNKKLGFYTVKARRITSNQLPEATFSLEKYKIIPYKAYMAKRKEMTAEKENIKKNSIHKKGPKFYARTINNKKIASKKMLEENNIVVLNFWFHTCPPCKKEIPKLNELRNQYKDNKNVKFIAVGLDDKETIQKFLETHPIDYDIVDDGRWLASKFRITSYPTNIIIDQEGKIEFFETGYTPNIKGIMTNKIDELLDK